MRNLDDLSKEELLAIIELQRREEERPSILGSLITGFLMFGAFSMGSDLHHYLHRND